MTEREKNEKCRKALECLKNGFNCAQAVCTSFSKDFGIKEHEAAKMACALGAGMSRNGEVCGAVSGALMVIGLKYGSSIPADTDSKEKSYEKGTEFIRQFKAKHRTIICRELIETDISTPEGLNIARQKGIFDNICRGLVTDSIEIIENMSVK